MRVSLSLVGKYSRRAASDFDYTILQTADFVPDKEKLEKMKYYLQEYKRYKKNLRNNLDGEYSTIDAYIQYLRNECVDISSNSSQLANYAVEITYNGEKTMVEFAWRLFPDGVLENIIDNTDTNIFFPVEDEKGDIRYLWKTYSLEEFYLEDLYEN